LETSTITHPTTQRHIADDLNLLSLSRLSHILIKFSWVPFYLKLVCLLSNIQQSYCVLFIFLWKVSQKS